jgi:uncharacterized membrane protein
MDRLRMEYVGIFYIHLEYFTPIWNILRPFGIFYAHLVYFVGALCGHVAYFSVLVCCTMKTLATLCCADVQQT